MKKRVFISSPSLVGSHKEQKRAAWLVEMLVEHGFAPFIQHLFLRSSDWSEAKFPWLLVSDCVLRLPGDALEQDQECLYAINNDIPVYADVEELFKKETDKLQGD